MSRRAIGSFNFGKGTINRAAYYETMTDLYGQVFIKRSPSGWKQYRKQLNDKNETKVDEAAAEDESFEMFNSTEITQGDQTGP